ncbi:MAG: kelch repeat-containing protein, partial [Terriglobia bacterium]
AVYNPNLNVMIVFGGSDESGNRYNDLWVLSDANGLGGTPAWTEIFPTGGPPTARDSQSAVYDVADDRMTIYGGSCCGSGTSTQILGDAWVLSNATGMTGTPTWTELGPFKRSPDRTAHTGVYNASTNQMTIFGGAATVSGNSTNSVWILSKANGLSPSEMDK